jgi:hypothetical protein
VPIILNLETIVDGGTSDNLTNVSIHSLIVFGGMLKIDLINKVVYFGADGVSIFQSLKTNVFVQLINKHCPFHKCNLNVQTLSSLTLIAKIETLLACMYIFYN